MMPLHLAMEANTFLMNTNWPKTLTSHRLRDVQCRGPFHPVWVGQANKSAEYWQCTTCSSGQIGVLSIQHDAHSLAIIKTKL